MLPEVTQLEFVNTSTTNDLPTIGKSFLFDWQVGDFVVKDGRLVNIQDIEAIKQWITKVLKTEKFRFKIYENINYGITIEDLIVGHNYPQSFVESEIKREVAESLLKHPMIKSISEWSIEKDNPVLNINFTVSLIDGVTFTQEVSY